MFNKTRMFDFLLITILSVFIYVLFAGSYPLISPDEGRYIEVAREMAVSGNFITPHLNGTVFLDKPILFYWLEVGVIKFLGLHEWSVRLVPAFFAWLGCLLTYWTAVKLYNRRTGLLAGLMQATMLMYFLLAHYCDMNLMVAVLISAVLELFLLGIQSQNLLLRRIYLCLAYLASGLAFLTKGLMGFVFPGMIIGVWILFLKRSRLISKMHLISGLIIFLLVIAPWLILVQRQNHEFFNYFFVIQQFSRYLTANFNSHQPFYFYIPVLILGIFPWSLFLFQSLIFAVKKIKNSFQSSDKELFFLIWIFSILIFFSIPQSKVIGYILPIFPALALLIAHYLDVHWQYLAKSRSLKIVSFCLLAFGFVLSLALVILANKHNVAITTNLFYFSGMVFVTMFSAIIAVIFAYRLKKFTGFFALLLMMILAVEIICSASVRTFALMRQNSYIKQLGTELKATLGPETKIVLFDHYYQDLPIYFQRTVYIAANWDENDILLHDNWRRELAEDLLYKNHFQQELLISYQQLKQMWSENKVQIFVISPDDQEELAREFLAPPVYLLQRKEGMVVLSNLPLKPGALK